MAIPVVNIFEPIQSRETEKDCKENIFCQENYFRPREILPLSSLAVPLCYSHNITVYSFAFLFFQDNKGTNTMLFYCRRQIN